MSRKARGVITLTDIEDGLKGARSVTRYLYKGTESDTAPDAPSATLTWSTGNLSEITTGWSEDVPTVDATGSSRPWVSTLTFYQASSTSQDDTTTVTGSSPSKGFTFDGIVTFSNSSLTDGTNTYDPVSNINSGTTTIDGGKITTGTISTDQISADSITGDKIFSSSIITTSAQIDDGIITSAKIGNAEVDTLNIAGQAVTIPSSSYTSANVSIPQSITTWYDVQSLTYTSTGNPVQINFVCGLDVDISFSGGVNVDFALFRGTTLVETFTGSAGDAGFKSVVAIAYLDTDTSTGSRTYTVKARRTSGEGATASRRSLTALEVKR